MMHRLGSAALTERMGAALAGMLARMDVHGDAELVARQLGLAGAQGFATARAVAMLHAFMWEATQEGQHGDTLRREARAVEPFVAFDSSVSPRLRAMDCLRVILNGRLSEEEKHRLHHEWFVRPLPGRRRGGAPGFYWRHPEVPASLLHRVDFDEFSGDSEGEVLATEDEAWVDAYVARAFWTVL